MKVQFSSWNVGQSADCSQLLLFPLRRALRQHSAVTCQSISDARAAMLYDNRALVWLIRIGVFVGLLSAVVTVIYLTPVPGK